MDVHTLQIGDWKAKVGVEQFAVPKDIIECIRKFLIGWCDLYARDVCYPWMGLEVLGVPSPLVRVEITADIAGWDATGNGNGILERMYEIEVRPAGVGFYLTWCQEDGREPWTVGIRQAFEYVECEGVLQTPENRMQDDKALAETLGLPYIRCDTPDKIPREGRFWVRSDVPDPHFAEALERVSLVPVRDDGNKKWMLRRKLATLVPNPDFLAPEDHMWFFDEPGCLKPVQGARCEGVHIVVPGACAREGSPLRQFRRIGSTRAQVVKSLRLAARHGVPYMWQPLIPMLCEDVNGLLGFTFLRMFFGLRRREDGVVRASYAGGFANWGTSLRGHGTRDAIQRTIRVEK